MWRANSRYDEDKMLADMRASWGAQEDTAEPTRVDLKRKLDVAESDRTKYRDRARCRKIRLVDAETDLQETKADLKRVSDELGKSKADRWWTKMNLAQANADRERAERAAIRMSREATKITDSTLELEQCRFVSKRLSDAATTCWFCKELIMDVQMVGLNNNSPIADGTPLPEKMQCNGGHSICAGCAGMLADNFLGDQQTKRMCCGFLTSWPGNKLSRRCDKLYCREQMANVLPPEQVLEVATQSVLRKERAEVASESLSRRDDVPMTKSDQEDDIFTFKTPCCNIAWEADACMAVQCPGCERRFCQLCSRRMEKGMTSLQAHDHVRQCTRSKPSTARSSSRTKSIRSSYQGRRCTSP